MNVTWECKDYADGWIPFNTLASALEYQGNTGCVMRPVRLSTLDTSTTPASVEQSEGEPVGWETKAEWELEQRAFHWNPSWSEEETRKLIGDLWRQYCFAAAPTKPDAVTAGVVTGLVNYLWQEFCELPDRTSPEEYPDMAMVTLKELTAIVETWAERAALAAQPQAVNVLEGDWVLVPKEATKDQLNAARDWSVKKYGIGVGNDGAKGCYAAMLSAVVNAPEGDN